MPKPPRPPRPPRLLCLCLFFSFLVLTPFLFALPFSFLSGWVDAGKVNAFPSCDSSSWFVGGKEGTFGLASQTGGVGTNGRWNPYFYRKLRKGDIVGTLLDMNKGEIRYWVRSPSLQSLSELSPPSHAFTIDTRRSYLASVSLKYAQSCAKATFGHPFALWNLVEAHFGLNPSINQNQSLLPHIPINHLSINQPPQESLSLSIDQCPSPLFDLHQGPKDQVFVSRLLGSSSQQPGSSSSSSPGPGSSLFDLSRPLPFRLISPIYTQALPLGLASPGHAQTASSLTLAASNFDSNLVSPLLLYLLPIETLTHIFSFLSIYDLPSVAVACRSFYEVQTEPTLWNILIERDFHFGLDLGTSLFYGRISDRRRNRLLLNSSDSQQSSSSPAHSLAANSRLVSLTAPFPKSMTSSLELDSRHSKEGYSNGDEDGYAHEKEEEALYVHPYVPAEESMYSLSKERYRKRYNWEKCRYDAMFTIPTDNSVAAMVYDEKTQNMFYAVEDEFHVFNFASGNVSVGLLSTVGFITHLLLCADLLLIATDSDTIHLLEPDTGIQIVRLHVPLVSSIDAFHDEEADVLLILTGSKQHGVQLWAVEKISHILKKRSNPSHDGNHLPSRPTTSGTSIVRPSKVWFDLYAHGQNPVVSVSFLPHSKGAQFLTASSNGQVHIWRRKSRSHCITKREEGGDQDSMENPEDDTSSAEDSLSESDSASSTSSTSSAEEAEKPADSSLVDERFDFALYPFATWKMHCRTPDSQLTCMSLSPEGWYAAVSSSTGAVFVFDARDGSGAVDLPVTSFHNGGRRGEVRYTWRLHYECGGKLVTVQDDNSVRFWNQSTGLEEWALQTAGLAGSLLCTEDYLVVGLINGRVSFLDFNKTSLPEEMTQKSEDRRFNYFSKFTRHL